MYPQVKYYSQPQKAKKNRNYHLGVLWGAQAGPALHAYVNVLFGVSHWKKSQWCIY